MPKATLKLDWCSYEAAKYAVEHWHYSKSLSNSRNVFIGVWEDATFIGVIVFGIGAGNVTNGIRYGLASSHQMAELTRVALNNHQSPVSRIISIAIRMIKAQSPGIRLLISFADIQQGHYGGIYQAGNWIYTGMTASANQYFCRGKWVHTRTATNAGSLKGLPSRPLPAKLRYLMPLDAEMKKQIAPLAKPYPKRIENTLSAANIDIDVPVNQTGKGSENLTAALQT